MEDRSGPHRRDGGAGKPLRQPKECPSPETSWLVLNHKRVERICRDGEVEGIGQATQEGTPVAG